MKKTRNCAIIARRGGWEIRGGEREGELDVKFNTYGGGLYFFIPFANWKRSGRVIRVQIEILTLE